MLSNRLPRDREPNRWSRALEAARAAGTPLLDLTESNPTRVGLGGADAELLQGLADPRGLDYEPDPCGLRSARQAVSGYYAGRGLSVGADQIVLTASTSESYSHLFHLLAAPGEAVLAPAPSYPLLEGLAALAGVELRRYRLAWDGAWHLDRASLERCVDRTARAVVVVQPNNPSGSCLDPEEIGFVEDLCERHGMAILSDEVFLDFPWPPSEGATHSRGLLPSLLGERRVPTFALGGISKLCAMPQLKLGWIAACGPVPARDEALRGLEWITDLFLSPSTPVQLALPRLLEARHAVRERVRERIAANLRRLRATVAKRSEISLLETDGGWSAVLRVPRRGGEEEWALALLERGVAVHPGYFYDFEGEAWLVVSLIVPTAVLDAGLTRIEELAGAQW